MKDYVIEFTAVTYVMAESEEDALRQFHSSPDIEVIEDATVSEM